MAERSGALLDQEEYLDHIEPFQTLKVVDQTDPEPHHEKGLGESITYKLFFSDGSAMPVRRMVPKEQESELSVDFTFPLGTEMEGFNTHIALALAKEKIHSRMVGTNEANGHSLSHDAWLTLLALAYDDALQKNDSRQTCKPDRSVSIAYSMALLKAFNMESHASEHKRDIEITIGMDPGPIGKIPINPVEAALFATWSGRQIIKLPKIAYRNFREEPPVEAFKRTYELGRTFSVKPMQLWNTADKLRTISKGETNALLDSIPWEAVMIIHFFKSRYNQKQLLATRLGNRPNIRLLDEDGIHISGADPSVIKGFIAKAALAVKLIDERVDKTELAEALNTYLSP